MRYQFTVKLTQSNQMIGKVISWLTLAMVVVLSINVLASWLFNTSSMFLTESISWMHSANFLLAAAFTLAKDEHVRVDIFYAKMSARGKAWVDLLGSLLFLLPVCIFILWASWPFVVASWNINEASAEAGGIPATYILKGFLLLMPLLLIMQAFHQIALSIDSLFYTHKFSTHKSRGTG